MGDALWQFLSNHLISHHQNEDEAAQESTGRCLTSDSPPCQSIRKLGFKPEEIKLMINGHAHIDRAGAFACFKSRFGAQMAVMKDDVAAMESGDRDDFKYSNDFVYPEVKVDRVLRDGDSIRMGEVLLTVYHTPGHTRGTTTWFASIVVKGKPYTVMFPDGAGFNPGYRL